MEPNSHKKRILRIIARLNIGGPAISVINLTHYLQNEFETKLVIGNISEGEESMDYLLEQYNLKPVYLNTLKRELSFIGDIKSVFAVYRIIREFQPDIVHTHTAKAGAIGRSAVILYNLMHLRFGKNKIKLIHTFHGHVFKGYFNRFVTFVFIIIEKTLAIFTDVIIVTSDAIKKELSDKYKIAPDKKIRVIYEGRLELEQFFNIDNSHNSDAGKLMEQPIITTVGRLIHIKGQKFLIQAFSKLKVPAKLLIVGDGILRKELSELSNKLGLSDKVEFTGYIRDVAMIYKKTDIFVLSSLNEGAPFTIIEALASARPVIATDVGGVKDLLGSKVSTISDNIYLCERGILVPSGDVDAIAMAIDYLIKNPEIGYSIGIAGREFVKNVFTFDRMIKNMSLLYTGIL